MSDLRITHSDMKIDKHTTGKVVAGALAALAIIGVGVYSYQAGMFRPDSPVAYNDLPNPGMPVNMK
jgi:hypothetical protein